MTDLPAEDAKLVTLARATRARTGAAEGAAVRDSDGRTYARVPRARVTSLVSSAERSLMGHSFVVVVPGRVHAGRGNGHCIHDRARPAGGRAGRPAGGPRCPIPRPVTFSS